MPDPLTLSLTPSEEAVESRVGDETVILHLGNGTYYGLDPIGTVIWEMLKAGDAQPKIRDAILARYDVTPEVVEADMRRFLSDLLAQSILVGA